MMSLAGIPLVLEHPGNDQTLKIENFIERYISTSSYLPWLRPSNPPSGSANLTFPWPRPEPSFRLFRFRWPQGASRWAHGHYLASSDQVEQFISVAYGDDGGYNPIPLVISTPEISKMAGLDDPKDNIITTNVYLLPPTPLSGIRGLTGQTQSLYLISVVDARFFWYQNSSGDVEFDKDTTWDDLLNMMIEQIDITGKFTADTISSKYIKPSSMFNLSYQPVPFLIDAICFNVGFRFIANFDGTYVAKNSDSEWDRLKQDFDNNPSSRIVMAGGPRRQFTTPI